MTKFFAVPALPAEQQDREQNPSGGPLGWVVVDQDDVIVRGRMFMERTEAEQIAATLNATK